MTLMNYKKKVYSGMCICGHDHMKHHGALVCHPDIAKIESRIPGTCLAYGNNEREGLGPDGEDHCFGYVDKDDPAIQGREMKLKELVNQNNQVRFTRYFDGQLWYVVTEPRLDDSQNERYPTTVYVTTGFEFPVPISDIGNATFMAEDKAILFMRYIRKHLDMLEKAKGQQSELS